MTDFEYAVHVGVSDVDHPRSLWRRVPGSPVWQFLSLRDWQWYPDIEIGVRPAPQLQTVSPEHAAGLEADRQRFVQYWFLIGTDQATGSAERLPKVLRRRTSPETVIEEAFGDTLAWYETDQAKALEEGRDSYPELQPTDAATAEDFIRERLGVSDATVL